MGSGLWRLSEARTVVRNCSCECSWGTSRRTRREGLAWTAEARTRAEMIDWESMLRESRECVRRCEDDGEGTHKLKATQS
jgi:hypothetical protein